MATKKTTPLGRARKAYHAAKKKFKAGHKGSSAALDKAASRMNAESCKASTTPKLNGTKKHKKRASKKRSTTKGKKKTSRKRKSRG